MEPGAVSSIIMRSHFQELLGEKAPVRAPLGTLVGAELLSTGSGGSVLHTEGNVGRSGT